ncbi:hypothetical protein MLD38_004809 [Melastoma candidum]|uniref:Uncharacterized protein n=1 Tax=Melastoma candidum TaxID=119954 RepID=A0ACB9S8T7_9MYRT|nr:hypothetical protein MLD38_004809 [Melastoma candidum]
MVAYRQVLIVVLAWACASLHYCTKASYDRTLKKRICNGETYSQHELFFYQQEDYECAVNTAITAILKYTKGHTSNGYIYGGKCSDGGQAYVYGYGFCRSELSAEDCNNCMADAKDSLFKECTHSVGAQVELQDCRIRYENYRFMDYPS